MSRFLKLAFFLFIISAAPAYLFPQIKTPVVDDVPDVEFNVKENINRYKARVTLYGGKSFNGEIVLNTDVLINPSDDTGRVYSFDNVRRITVNMWSKQRKGSGWIFYPESYEIILKNNICINHKGNLDFLNRVRFTRGDGKPVYLYTFFYDYYKKGKWINTGGVSEKAIPSRPAEGTLYIIELN